MQVIDTTANTAIIPEIWSRRFYEVLRAKLPFIDLVDDSYSGDIQDMGDIVNINTIPDFDEANDLAEGAAGEAESITSTGQQLVINKRPYKDYVVTKKAQLQSIPFMDKLREKAIFAINTKIQSYIIAETIPSASAPDHQIAYDAGTTMTVADILEAKELLMLQNVEQDDDIYAVMGASQYIDCLSITGFSSRDFIPAGSPNVTGDLPGGLYGFTPRVTTAVGDTSYFFHRSYLTIAFQQMLNIEVVSMGGEGIRATRVNCDILMGVKQLSNKRVVTIS